MTSERERLGRINCLDVVLGAATLDPHNPRLLASRPTVSQFRCYLLKFRAQKKLKRFHGMGKLRLDSRKRAKEPDKSISRQVMIYKVNAKIGTPAEPKRCLGVFSSSETV
ncbi:hypothetical protein PoB_000680100 [Plakobranchus ocellatus]|uniref:Uncharacterized protein n=1 Tax=Plakobranchus ocellatus TaxID=259542 RepID=A0AAV3YAT6_9GAST|nr:hypothetical protein PoB_000680100 [Plakobranchus ocellatus]